MATHGSLGEYLAGQDDWPTYLERVEEYFVANDVGGEGSDAKKRAILLSCCGTTTYQVAKQLFAPTKLNTCTYKQVNCRKAHWSFCSYADCSHSALQVQLQGSHAW